MRRSCADDRIARLPKPALPMVRRHLVLAAALLSLLATPLRCQDRELQLRDSQERVLRGAKLVLSDVTGRRLETRSDVEGRITIPADFRLAHLVATDIQGEGREVEVDSRTLWSDEHPTIRVAGVQTPVGADVALARTRDALSRAGFGEFTTEWRDLRSSLLKEGITQDRLTTIDRALDEIESTRKRLLVSIGEPARMTAAEALDHLDGVEAFLVQWRALREQLKDVSRLARTRPDTEAARRQAGLEKRFLSAAASLVGAIRDTAQAIDAPISNLAADAVDHELDGLGLGRVEVQVRLECWLLAQNARPPVRSITPAPAEGLRVELRRSVCRADPESLTIPEGRSIASTFVTTDETEGTASLVASCAGFADVTVDLPIRFPWKSVLALLGGLLAGVFLRGRLIHAPQAARRRPRSTFVVDLIAGLVVLAAWFAGAIAVLAPRWPDLDPRVGLWMKVLAGACCGLVGLPFVSGWVKRWLASA